MANINITQERVKYLFDYKDGKLYWKNKTSSRHRVNIGDEAGCLIKNGRDIRHKIKVDYSLYFRYRLIFLYHNGYMPDVVDHANRNPLDDRIENLRAATQNQNAQNAKSRVGSSSIYLGVSYDKFKNLWVSRIWTKDGAKHLGRYTTQEDAALAYNKAAVRYHGEFANLNIIKKR